MRTQDIRTSRVRIAAVFGVFCLLDSFHLDTNFRIWFWDNYTFLYTVIYPLFSVFSSCMYQSDNLWCYKQEFANILLCRKHCDINWLKPPLSDRRLSYSRQMQKRERTGTSFLYCRLSNLVDLSFECLSFSNKRKNHTLSQSSHVSAIAYAWLPLVRK